MTEKLPLVLLGKARVPGKKGLDARDDWPGNEVWTVGTAKINNADRYYEFHGLDYAGREMTRQLSPDAERLGRIIPLNNSISAMLMEAYIEGYRDIRIAGCPMTASDEYVAQARSVAMAVGFLRGMSYARGRAWQIKVVWDDEPARLDYFRIHQNGDNHQ